VTKAHYFVKLFSEKSHDILLGFPQINSPLLQKQILKLVLILSGTSFLWPHEFGKLYANNQSNYKIIMI
jgi:hypothetical protein